MKRRAVLKALGPCLILLPLSAASFVAVAAPAARVPGIQDAVLGWQLTQARVLNPGATTISPQGTLTSGYVLEATAKAIDPDTPVQNGTFKIDLNAFSPSQDMPGQKAGTWYVRGDWQITKRNIAAAEQDARHGPSFLNGSLSVELPFNPATEGPVNAAVSLSRRRKRAAGRLVTVPSTAMRHSKACFRSMPRSGRTWAQPWAQRGKS
jgi:hypothetical protein